MKNNRNTQDLIRRSAAISAVLLVSLCGPALAQEQRPEGERREAQRLEREREERRLERSQDRERDEMRQNEARRGAPMLREDGRERFEQLQRRLDELQEQINQLRGPGALQERAQLQQQRREMQDRRPERRGFQSGMRPGRFGAPPPPRDELQRRLHHLQVAIDNLHAAGLHEPAERLEQQKQRFAGGDHNPQLRSDNEANERLAGELDALRAELRELGNAVRELRARVEREPEK